MPKETPARCNEQEKRRGRFRGCREKSGAEDTSRRVATLDRKLRVKKLASRQIALAKRIRTTNNESRSVWFGAAARWPTRTVGEAGQGYTALSINLRRFTITTSGHETDDDDGGGKGEIKIISSPSIEKEGTNDRRRSTTKNCGTRGGIPSGRGETIACRVCDCFKRTRNCCLACLRVRVEIPSTNYAISLQLRRGIKTVLRVFLGNRDVFRNEKTLRRTLPEILRTNRVSLIDHLNTLRGLRIGRRKDFLRSKMKGHWSVLFTARCFIFRNNFSLGQKIAHVVLSSISRV